MEKILNESKMVPKSVFSSITQTWNGVENQHDGAVALVMGLGSSVAFAGNMVSDVEIVVMVNDYKPIEVKDLPQAVQDTIKKDFADLTIKEAAVEESEEGTKTYKVTFTDAEGTDSEVFFNEKGEVLK